MKKSLLAMLVLALLVAGCGSPVETPKAPANPTYAYRCCVSQGFNFEEDRQDVFGFVNHLKIGEEELATDLWVTDALYAGDVDRCPHCGLPLSEEGTGLIRVAGVLSEVSWHGDYADPLEFAVQVSTDNKNTLATLFHKTMSNTEVEIEFTVYDYDPEVKKHYKCFHSNGVKLKGLVSKQAGELDMSINMEQSMEVVSPKNYTLALSVMPQNVEQKIHLAVSTSDRFVKLFGVDMAG